MEINHYYTYIFYFIALTFKTIYMNSNFSTKKQNVFFERMQELKKSIEQANKKLKEKTEKEIKKWNNFYGIKIKIKERRKIIFQGDLLQFETSFNREMLILKMKGTEKFLNKELIMLLPKNKKMHKDTRGYVVLEI